MSRPLGPTEIQVRHHRQTLELQSSVGLTLSMMFLIFMALYFLVPLIWMLISTTKNQSDLFATPMFSFPPKIRLGYNLHLLFTLQHSIFLRWLGNSFLYAGVIAVVSTFISASMGYALSKYAFRGRSIIFWIVLCSMMIPGAVSVIPVFILEKTLGMLDTYLAVILPQLVNPFGAYYMMTYIGEVMPSELIEAARIDGASESRIFWQITLGIIRPGLVTLLLISFTGSWNNFFLPLLVLTKPQLFPVTLGLNNWLGQLGAHVINLPWYPLLITGSVVSIIPTLIVFPFLRRYIASGATTGSVKV